MQCSCWHSTDEVVLDCFVKRQVKRDRERVCHHHSDYKTHLFIKRRSVRCCACGLVSPYERDTPLSCKESVPSDGYAANRSITNGKPLPHQAAVLCCPAECLWQCSVLLFLCSAYPTDQLQHRGTPNSARPLYLEGPPSPREAPLRSSSSPPNSTGSTVDSDGWEPRFTSLPATPEFTLPAQSRQSFGGFKRGAGGGGGAGGPQTKRSRSAGFTLERKKVDKIKKKKKLKRRGGEEGEKLPLVPERPLLGRVIKQEPQDHCEHSGVTEGIGEDRPRATTTATATADTGPSTPATRDSSQAETVSELQLQCKEEPGLGSPSSLYPGFRGQDTEEEDETTARVEREAVAPGKRTVIRQGKQVVFRDEDGFGNDEDIMVDSDDDSWNLVTCFCTKPFAGRPMIECNECNTWIHLSCAKIRKSNVPEEYVCQQCRDSKFDIRRSNRSRLGSRKLCVD